MSGYAATEQTPARARCLGASQLVLLYHNSVEVNLQRAVVGVRVGVGVGVGGRCKLNRFTALASARGGAQMGAKL